MWHSAQRSLPPHPGERSVGPGLQTKGGEMIKSMEIATTAAYSIRNTKGSVHVQSAITHSKQSNPTTEN